MQAVETEIKIRLENREVFESKLPRLGFRRMTERAFEHNTLFDTPNRELRSRRQILRLRHYGGAWVVTHKAAPPGVSEEGPHKSRIETESVVEDGRAMARIFQALGFHPVFVYEKWRTEWADGEGQCVLDDTPLGAYAELEGPGAWIDRTAKSLQIGESQYLKLSYGRIFEAWRERTQCKAVNFTFAEIPPSFR